MRKHLSSIVLLVILLLPVAFTSLLSINIVAASGNVTINDFTSNVTKGTVPLNARLNGSVTGNVTNWLWEFYNPQIDHWSYSTGNRTTGHTFGRAGAYG